MSVITIKWLEDDFDCETCGPSYASGAVVSMDGEPLVTLLPVAHCHGGESWHQDDVLRAILQHLGHTLVEKLA